MSLFPLQTRREAVEAAVERTRLFGVIRCDRPEDALWAARIAYEAGLELVEITLTVPGALEVVRELARTPGRLVGAGTLLAAEEARQAVEAGAAFLVSPVLAGEVVEVAQRAQVWVSVAGATPTELLAGHRMGADALKVFPADTLGGPRFLKLVRDPLPFLRLMPSGGVSAANAREHLEAGSVALAMATSIFERTAIARRDADALARRVEEALAACARR